MRVVIVSGRRLTDILSLLPVPMAFLAGTYGIELQTPSDGRIERADYATIRPPLERLKPFWEKIIAGRSGFFLEDKGWALALHARYAGEVEAMQVIATIWQMLNKVSISGQFRIFTGYKFLEIAPVLAHKGETVFFLLSRFPWPGARPLYIGDDNKDEEAFDMIHSVGGIAVSVSHSNDPPPSTRADYNLESPAAVRRWLSNLT
jgi:trehalose-phosphatase